MKTLLLCLTLLGGVGAVSAQTTNSLSLTNGMLFDCTNGTVFSATNIILRGHVRVLDRQSGMYLECDLLTIGMQTNATKQARTNRPAPPKTTGQPARAAQLDSGRLDYIIAEGNVYITTTDSQIVGDRAVYTATNDLFVVTGEMVILGRDQAVGLGSRVIFDRAAGTARGDGPFAIESLGPLPVGTNAPGRKVSTNIPPASPAPPGAK